jgi:flagellar secretion chaperone FliS
MLPNGYPAAAYRKVSVDTAPPVEIVLMLYRRAILSARLGAECIESKQLEKAHRNLVRAQAIVIELQASLDHGVGEIASSLFAVYDYLYRDLTEANLTKNADRARQVADMLESLLEAWETVTGKGGAEVAG